MSRQSAVVAQEVRPAVHIRSGSGVAICGQPAKQEQLRVWGDDDINCEACIRSYCAGHRIGGKA